MSEAKTKQQGAVQTTGHAWDGDIQEFNNPLPRWWLWSFYGTVLFAIIYWIIYPAWPVGSTYTKGLLNTITFTVDGEPHTTHWNTRARLIKDMQEGKEALRSKEYMEKVAAASYAQILADPDMMAFVRSVAKGLFGDNCAACHGSGGTGVMGLFPNLADDDWLWGGTVEDIQTTLAEGRVGYMPAFGRTFSEEQIDDVANFVLSLSGYDVAADKLVRGKQLFTTDAGGCYYCHTAAGTGLQSQGAADLTDNIWTVADVSGQADLKSNVAAVKSVVRNGVHRIMPGWQGRLDATQIKLLTVYVHELGGGQ
ncbi:MAG: cytochrome-c oxidase, cbb3-type subunit III [Thiohalobacteraceae bacterium]|nr:cytochrome-c oxidase, cbb3-type subunit III [Gammaproteobacteria bacterium]